MSCSVVYCSTEAVDICQCRACWHDICSGVSPSTPLLIAGEGDLPEQHPAAFATDLHMRAFREQAHPLLFCRLKRAQDTAAMLDSQISHAKQTAAANAQQQVCLV